MISQTFTPPPAIYTCQFCHQEFRSFEDLEIIPQLSPLCSSRCRFKLIFSIFAGYTQERLLCLSKLMSYEPKPSFNRQETCFNLVKGCFLRINRDKTAKQGQNGVVPKTGTRIGTNNPLYKGLSLVPVFNNCPLLEVLPC